MAPEIQPVLDPADAALMLTPEQLRSQGPKNTNVSFLRRTQYMTPQNARANVPLTRTNPRTTKPSARKASMTAADFAREDQENIKRHVQRGFDLAHPESVQFNPPQARAHPISPAERDAWRHPVHPDNPRLKPVEFYPILPDFDSTTDGGGFASVKFDKPPLPAYRGRRDDRTDVALLYATQNTALMPAWQAKKDAYDKNPDLYDDPGPEPYEWSYNVPPQPEDAWKVRKALNDANPDKDDPFLWEDLADPANEGVSGISFEKVRMYPTAVQQPVNSSRFTAISLFDPDKMPASTARRKAQGRAAYYYPIFERLRLRADRARAGRSGGPVLNEDNADIPDRLVIAARELTAAEKVARYHYRGQHDSNFAAEYRKMEAEAEAAAAADEEAALASAAPEPTADDDEHDDDGARGRHRDGSAAEQGDVSMVDAEADVDAALNRGIDAAFESATNGVPAHHDAEWPSFSRR